MRRRRDGGATRRTGRAGSGRARATVGWRHVVPASLTILTAAEPAGRELPMPPVFFGLISLLLFGLALAFLWSFRNTAAKTDPRNVGEPRQGHDAHRPRRAAR